MMEYQDRALTLSNTCQMLDQTVDVVHRLCNILLNQVPGASDRICTVMIDSRRSAKNDTPAAHDGAVNP